jgi:flagellin-like protein
LKLSVHKRRVAISEIMGTLIMVAITLVAGAAVFGWVNGQAGVSENAYGQSAANGINYLKEHFAPVTNTFTGPGGAACSGSPTACTVANFWVFNNGQLYFTLSSLQIQSAVGASSFLNIVYTPTGYSAYNSAGTKLGCSNTPGFSVPSTSPIPAGTLSSSPYSVTIPTSCVGVNSIMVGQGYVITMTGLYGNVVQFQVTANG